MTAEIFEPFFLDTPHGRVFCLYRAPDDAAECVLFVPPFAEEMNKCRRQFSDTAAALIDRGYATLIVDLYGTGDSAGDFSEATWLHWKSDLKAAIEWAGTRGSRVTSLVATRLGCILAADALRDSGHRMRKSIFWQPVLTGKQFMTQFFRLRVAASMMSDKDNETVNDLRGKLANNEILEVAGYEISSDLAAGVEGTDLLATLNPNLGELQIVEIGSVRDSGLSPAGQKVVASAIVLGMAASGARIDGEPFWSTTEIVVNNELTQVSCEYISGNADNEN